MISKNNFDLIKEDLSYQLKGRGLEVRLSREEWDTFLGWKERGKSILKGSKGFKAEIVVPYVITKFGKKTKNGFYFRKTTLFSVEQTG